MVVVLPGNRCMAWFYRVGALVGSALVNDIPYRQA
ncbi:hypothetical protein N825_33985 [Skermanella stibiiresistens SB22]|uniref:Uncharacterized protein n=1 Tax=Skermanella stibiiresistens SB22 TaxID=1385369 RepID=W9H413_9PROT|nr:hypothetical protein N825_33985 [Skermanella stibiiresistens SB22]